MCVGRAISGITEAFEGRIGIAARDMRSGLCYRLRSAARFPTASVIKLPVLVHTLMLADEGYLGLGERLTMTPNDRVPGAGILTALSDGFTLSIRDACALMIALSDNAATNLILDRVGIDGVNARMRSLGLRATTLHRKVFSAGPPISAQNARYGLGVTTPGEMLRLLEMISRRRAGTGSAREYLEMQQDRDGIPRYLSGACAYAGKSGAVDAVRNDVGLVRVAGRDIAVAAFCCAMPRPLWTADNPGLLAIGQIARALVMEWEPSAFR